jgi:hypothetical protein
MICKSVTVAMSDIVVMVKHAELSVEITHLICFMQLLIFSPRNLVLTLRVFGAWGSVVVKALTTSRKVWGSISSDVTGDFF